MMLKYQNHRVIQIFSSDSDDNDNDSDSESVVKETNHAQNNQDDMEKQK